MKKQQLVFNFHGNKAYSSVLQMFKTFQTVLAKAEEYAKDGKKYRMMKARCASL